MTDASGILVERHGRLLVVTIARQTSRNAIDRAASVAIAAAMDQLDANVDISVGIITGAGGHFCSGMDLKAFANGERVELPGRGLAGITETPPAKPLIAAVNGYAVAGGLELAVMADMRVADEDAIFGVFCRRWGVPLIDGGTVRLPRIVGMGHAMDMILTGRPVSAQEGKAMGLVNRITPKGGALEAAKTLARQIAAFPQACMLADRLSAHEQWGMSYEAAIRNEGRLGAPIVQAEGVAGAARFVGGAGRHGAFEDAA